MRHRAELECKNNKNDELNPAVKSAAGFSKDIMKRIEEFSTEELADELLTRFDHAIIVGKRIRSKNGTFTTFRKAIGDAHTCAGIAMDIQVSLIHGLLSQAQQMKPEDG